MATARRIDWLLAPAAPSTAAPSPLPAVAFVGLLVLLLAAFGGLALLVRAQPVLGPDIAVERAVQSVQAQPLDALTVAISWLGFPPWSIVVDGIIVLALAISGRRWGALCAALAAAGSAGLWFLVLDLVHRPRPSPDLVHVMAQIGYGSFPSGHVLNLTTFYGSLACVALVTMRPGGGRRIVVALCVGLIALIGVVRIYSGEHWPSDVLAGYLLGAACLLVTVQIYLTGMRRARRGSVWHSNTS